MYKGKFDAKYRDQRPSVEERIAQNPRRREPENRDAFSAQYPAPQKSPAKKKSRTGTIVFYTIYFLFIIGFFGGMFFVTDWLEGWLVDYQAAQPTTKCEEVFQELFADPDWASLYERVGIEDTKYETKDAFVAYMENLVGGQELTYMETSAGLSGDKKYYVKLGDERIGSFTLVTEEESVTDIPQWQLGTVELFFERGHEVTVQKQDGQTVLINGVALDDAYTIQIGSTLAENYLPTGVHGMRIYTQKLTGLMAEPEVTVIDENGNNVDVSYDAEKGIYVAQTSINTISEEEEKLVLNAGKTYALYMVEKASGGELARYFDSTSQLYKTITGMNLWMQASSGHNFANESVSGYCRYTDELFSARVTLSLNVTRTNGSVKEYTVDSTLFFEKLANGWRCTEMTNVDVQQQVAEVRITFMNEDTQLSSEFYDASSKQLTTPVISAPEGKVFSGWVREDVDENGTKTLTLVFTPDENGNVTVAEGYTLEPMTLYALFEDAAESEGEE